jgi:hypothetical protein
VSTLRTEMPHGAQLVRYLYQSAPPWARQVPTSGGQTTILHGDPGSGLEEAAAWIAEATAPSVGAVITLDAGPVITFDPSLIGDYTTLVNKFVIDVAVGAFGEDAASALGALRRGESRDLSELNIVHDDFLRFAATLNEPDVGYAPGSLAAILRNTPKSLLMVINAHLLTTRWSRDALWELRGVIQDEGQHALVLTCPTEARDALAGAAAPFFGSGAVAEVGNDRDERFWTRVARTHHLVIESEDLEFVLARTWGLAVPTLAVLLDAQESGPSAALNKHVRRALERVPLVFQLARVVNRYGPELLLRLSRGLPPYGIPSATARDVNRALRQLAFHGLIARVGRRGWRVADPFLSDALLSRPLVAW